uniref:LCCL domain-containing protein n=1 Tax=Angiostrongylus cantonensis TaxID=6313 RepID=A0A158P6A4_ANGCA
MTADDACLDDDRLPGHVTCSAPCMTINITAIGGKHDGRVVGIVRDCQTYFHNPKSLPEGTTRMCRHSERETTRSQRYDDYPLSK